MDQGRTLSLTRDEETSTLWRRVEVNRKDPGGLAALVSYVVLLPCRSPDHLTGRESDAAAQRVFDDLALEHRQNDGAGMLVQAGLGAWIPSVMADLQVQGAWNLAGDHPQQHFDMQPGNRLRERERRRDAGPGTH